MHYMHLFQKSPKYVFAYAGMQMHNYPYPINDILECKQKEEQQCEQD